MDVLLAAGVTGQAGLQGHAGLQSGSMGPASVRVRSERSALLPAAVGTGDNLSKQLVYDFPLLPSSDAWELRPAVDQRLG